MHLGSLATTVGDWNADPVFVAGLAVAALLYARGWLVLRHRDVAGVEWWRAVSFVAALLFLVLAACSPIDALSADLFWVHMIQHLLILLVVGPLLAVAAPWSPWWNGLPGFVRYRVVELTDRGRRPFWRSSPTALKLPLTSLGIFTAGMWVWHWPPLYDLALRNEVIHDYGEHTTFLLIGIAFWILVIPSPPFRPAIGLIGRALYVGVALTQNVVLSVVLGFAPKPLYAPYAALIHRLGNISALDDQKIGSAIMWSAGDLPFAIAMVALAQIWLQGQMTDPVREDVLTGVGPAR